MAASFFALLAGPAVGQTPIPPAAIARDWEHLAAAENARAATPTQLQLLLRLTHSANVELRRLSVRALGRLERPELSDTIARSLHDTAPAVRAQAAWSIAQANFPNRTPAAMRDTVARALTAERNSLVIAGLAETMGRLRQSDVNAARVTVAQLAPLLDGNGVVRLGAARGLQFILRQPAALRPALDTARGTLVRAATSHTGSDATSLHTRRLATQILGLRRLADEATALRILSDPDPFVRREAVLVASVATDTSVVRTLTTRASRDPFWLVRYEALRQYGRRLGATGSCSDVMPFTRDASMHVRLVAIDLLAAGCIKQDNTTAYLDSVVQTLPRGMNDEWHPAAHALVSLAARDAARARSRMAPFIAHPNLFVRTYAAAAAGAARDTSILMRLTRDPHPNVRTAAVQELSKLMGHAADTLYLGQLGQDDSQLLIAVTAALDSTTTPNVAPQILDALDRVTQQRSENSRDGREALLNVAGHLGSGALAARVQPYLRDFDPAIANRAADVLKAWTGTRPETAPETLPAEAMPSYEELTRLAKTTLTMVMANGDTIVLRLYPFDAPTNAARFARLAQAGYFNGLTLHRVEPNFVVQGGSPNANEYRGAPRFSRDEIGIPNWRGTVGLSTRGHDTGDAQLFINIVDNALLDQLYTVFAEVTRGMENVDRMLEGATIRKIIVRSGK